MLDTAEAVEALSIARDHALRTVAPNLGKEGQMESHSDHSTDRNGNDADTTKARKTLGFTGFDAVGATRFELATSTSRT